MISLLYFVDDAADKTSMKCLSALESIDDDLDEHNIPAVKMSDKAEARQYGVKSFPSIIVFVKKIPELYQGKVLWSYLSFSLYFMGLYNSKLLLKVMLLMKRQC